jgi:two-component sensor histidine kinase
MVRAVESQAPEISVRAPAAGWRFLPRPRSLIGVAIAAAVFAALLLPLTRNTYIEILGETLLVAVILLTAFHAAGAWEQKVVPRWVAQLFAVVLAAPLGPLIVQLLTAGGDFSRFVNSHAHVRGYFLVTQAALLFGSFGALGAMVRDREAQARAQALQFALEREKLERQAADARLKLMTAQIQPHFLLNTLANVQELVETGSPRAAPVFRSLIAYLRATLPQLQQDDATLADEGALVRAYLELMHMRMPDRLSYSVDIADDVKALRFPPMGLLTLVENAIEHGVDPSVEPCRVDVAARRVDAHTLHLSVSDTGVGMSEDAGEGTGLANLRERLKTAFGPQARVELSEVQPHGLRADIRLQLPAQA